MPETPDPSSSLLPPRPPGFVRRALAGAWHAPGGAFFLIRRPSLWLLAALPTALAAGLVLSAVLATLTVAPTIENAVLPASRESPMLVELAVRIGLWTAMLGAAAVAGLALALLLSGSLLDRLSRRVEEIERGQAPDRSPGLAWELKQSVKSAAWFLLAAPVVLLLGLVPFLGPLLALLWAGHSAAWQQTEAALTRRGLGFPERRAWHRAHRAESLGFGVVSVLPLLVPGVNLLLAPLVVPALAIGGTRLVLELFDVEADASEAQPADPEAAGKASEGEAPEAGPPSAENEGRQPPQPETAAFDEDLDP